MGVANFDYRKELLKRQQLVKEISPRETGHRFCQDQDPTQTELCFLYSGCKTMRTRIKVLTASHALAVSDSLTLSLIRGGKCLFRPQGQIYISDLKKTLGKHPVRLNYRKQTKHGQS